MIVFHDQRADRYSWRQMLLHFFWSLSTTSQCAFQLQFFMTEGPLNMVTYRHYCMSFGLCQPLLNVHSNYTEGPLNMVTNIYCFILSGLFQPLLHVHFNYSSSRLKGHSIWLQISTIVFFGLCQPILTVHSTYSFS